jgi:phosphatidylserine/phosphatidylglycerophosphate/cardiolipin synthase-like enzyme
VLTTSSVAPHAPLVAALIAAAGCGVHISIIVETHAGASIISVETHAGAQRVLSGREPVAAFLAVPGAEPWYWPVVARPALNARQHAKPAVADRSVLLLGSANLTGSGIGQSRGHLRKSGLLPARAADHISRLQRAR